MLLSELEQKLCFDIPRRIGIRACIHVAPNHFEYICNEHQFFPLYEALKATFNNQLHFIELKEIESNSFCTPTSEVKASHDSIILVLELLFKSHDDQKIQRFFISVLWKGKRSTFLTIKRFFKDTKDDLSQ